MDETTQQQTMGRIKARNARSRDTLGYTGAIGLLLSPAGPKNQKEVN